MTAEKPSLPLPPRHGEGASKRKKQPEPLHKRSLRAVARASSTATQNIVGAPKQLFDRINRELYKRNAELIARNKTMAVLRQLDEISLATSDIEEMTQQMANAVATKLGYDLVSIALFDDQCACLQWVAMASPVAWVRKSIGETSLLKKEIGVTIDSMSSRAVKEKKTLFIENLSEIFSPEFAKHLNTEAKANNHPDIKHSLVQPLRYSDKAIGLLVLSSGLPLDELSKYEEETIVGIIGLISLAIYKAKIYLDLQNTTAQLAKANQQLKDLDKAKSEFLSIASHQLYTPLTALRGYISMIQEGDFGQVPDEQKPILDILNKSAIRLIELIKNLLDISRIESGRLELNLQSIDLLEMAKELVQDLMPNAINKKLKLEFHQPEKPVAHVVVDQQRIRQVMLNYIDNSIKYTPAGKIDVYVEQKGDELVFYVKDTGKGITTEEIDKLFNKFTRVGGASRFHTEGTGLGLYVAKQIVNEHHGQVSVESPGTNKGSTFIMKLPIENSPKSLKVGQKASVEIKAAEVQKSEPSAPTTQVTPPPASKEKKEENPPQSTPPQS